MSRIAAFAMIAILSLTGCAPITIVTPAAPTEETPSPAPSHVSPEAPTSPDPHARNCLGEAVIVDPFEGPLGVIYGVYTTCYDEPIAWAEIDVSEQQLADYISSHGFDSAAFGCDNVGPFLFITSDESRAVIGDVMYDTVVEQLAVNDGVDEVNIGWSLSYTDPDLAYVCDIEADTGQEA